MELSFALDELQATGWSGMDSSGCAYGTDGRAYPTPIRVRQEFSQAGFSLTIERVDKYNCFRASWREAGNGRDSGAVVGGSETEAAVYALAQLRKSLATV